MTNTTIQTTPDDFQALKQAFDRCLDKMPTSERLRKPAIRDLFIALLDGHSTQLACDIFMSARFEVPEKSIIKISGDGI